MYIPYSDELRIVAHAVVKVEVKHLSVEKELSPKSKQPAVKTDKEDKFYHLSRFVIPLLFFISFFLFLLLYIDPPVIFSNNGINTHSYVAIMQANDTVSYKDPWFRNPFILETTTHYLQEIVTTPGGWTKFVVTLCIYSCHNTFFGTLFITGIGFLFFTIFALYIKGTGARRLYYVHYVPLIFLLTLCCWYELRYLAFMLPVAGALVLTLFYRHFEPISPLKQTVWLSIHFWLAWYLMQWGCLLLLIFIFIHAFSSKQRRLAFVIFAATVNCVLFFLIEKWLLPLDKTIRWASFIDFSGLPLYFVGFFPITAIIVSLINRIPSIQAGHPKIKGGIIQAVLFACVIIFTVMWLYRDPVNRNTRTIARTAHHIMNGKWDVILNENTESLFSEFPQKAGAVQLFMVHATNQALCHTGQAGERMFTFPQASFNYDPLLMLESTLSNGVVNWIPVLELTMDLGMVNSAEKIAGELMETMGPYPEILYRRALIQIAKDNNKAAVVYLKKLSFMPLYRKKAKRLLNNLHNKDSLFSESRFAKMYTNRDSVDYFLFNNVSHDAILRNLLQSNSGNKMAYDYLISYYLLTGQLEDVSILLQFAHSFGYTTLPRYWEEALCLKQAIQAQKSSTDVSFSGVRPEIVNRFFTFTQTWLQMENDPDAAAKLASSFGDSYFYFSIFRYSHGVFHE
jgi:hypothetical protein